jgi:hypothetical protein
MADDSFRPQKRQISQEEISQQDPPGNAAEELEQMAEMRRRAAAEVSEDFPSQPQGP